jgi:pimeloyl-ACP methyl ester carboxylesterase
MRILVNGSDTFVATGGRDFGTNLPAIVFLHGAGMDHSVWALLARAFAHHGYAVLAPDFPGHGRSAGTPLMSVAALADWTAALIDAAGAKAVRLVGHSMGSLVALETAARHPNKVTGLGLIATTATMRVSNDLVNAAKADDHDAVDMIAIWGEGYRATLGGSQAPGYGRWGVPNVCSNVRNPVRSLPTFPLAMPTRTRFPPPPRSRFRPSSFKGAAI